MTEADDQLPFDGEWEDDDGATIEIRGATLLEPNGNVVKITIKDNDACTMQKGGTTHVGKLYHEGQRIIWTDGSVWVRRAYDIAHQLGDDEKIDEVSLVPDICEREEPQQEKTVDEESGDARALAAALAAERARERQREARERNLTNAALAAVRGEPQLTMDQVLKLQKELYAGYDDDDFQWSLEQLAEVHEKDSEEFF